MFPDSFQIGQLKNDTRFSEGQFGLRISSERFTDRMSLVQTVNSQASVKLVCLWFFYFFLLPKPVKHNPCPAADFNSII